MGAANSISSSHKRMSGWTDCSLESRKVEASSLNSNFFLEVPAMNMQRPVEGPTCRRAKISKPQAALSTGPASKRVAPQLFCNVVATRSYL